MPLPVTTSSDDTQPSLPRARRVLIYRLGSLGDTVIALPCFHLIARTFPDAERTLLTNIPISARAPAAAAVLGSSGLVHRYLNYPVGTRNPWQLGRLALQLRRNRPDVLVYLAAPRGQVAIARDLRFFRLCGIRHIYGVPTGDLAANLPDPATGLLEAESHRLARTLASVGDAQLDDQASWDLHLTPAEIAAASAGLAPFSDLPYLVCAPGCKAPANDWEDSNWRALFQQLSAHCAGRYGLAMVGAESDRARCEGLLAAWQGPHVTFCGHSPREAAALLARAKLYLGPDSGPMHIAAAVGTPCVAIFTARLGLGIWFPRGAATSGSRHQVLYHRTDCSPCGLETCILEKKRCILSIAPEEVFQAAIRVLGLGTGRT